MPTDFAAFCRPIRILASDSQEGNRIGGFPPAGVMPAQVFPCTKYFATLKLNGDDKEISIFNSFEERAASNRSLPKHSGTIYSQADAPLIQFVVHGKSIRSRVKSTLISPLTSKALVLDPEERDEDGWLDSNIYHNSKMGGYPFYWHNKVSIRRQGRTLTEAGFTHLFQFSFPNNRDALISGNWPYGGYVMHVFVDDPDDPQDIRYGWG